MTYAGPPGLLTTLGERPELRAATEALISAYFPLGSPLPEPVAPSREFLLLLGSRSDPRRNLLIVENDRPVATASYRIFEFRGETRSRLRVAALGLIVTDPAARGRGLAVRLISEAETRARREGAVIAVLWSDLASFYSKLGYLIAGAEVQWTLDSAQVDLLRQRLRAEADLSSHQVRPLRSFAEIAALSDDGFGPYRNVADYDAYLDLPRSNFWVAEAKGTIRGWAFEGKGRDLFGVVHEFRGRTDSVPSLLWAHAGNHPAGLRLQLPIKSPFVSELEHWLGPGERGPMAFLKVLDAVGFADWIQDARLLGPRTNLCITESGSGNHALEFRSGGRALFRSADPGHLLQILAGPWRPEELVGLPQAIIEALADAPWPLPIYFWGLDSV